MPRRRGRVAVPLATLVVSFLVVLALGAWLRTSQSDSPPAVSFEIDSQTGFAINSETGFAIKSLTGFEIKSLTGSDGKEQTLPAGLRVTVSPLAPGTRGGSPRSAVAVEICVGPGPHWIPEG